MGGLPQDRDAAKPAAKATSPIEWAAAALSGVMLLGMIVYMLHAGLTREESPPDISFSIGASGKVAGGYFVPFTARNRGTSTASALGVVGRLTGQHGMVEESRARFDYLPGQSERQGGLFFSQDPSLYDLSIRGEGYVDP